MTFTGFFTSLGSGAETGSFVMFSETYSTAGPTSMLVDILGALALAAVPGTSTDKQVTLTSTRGYGSAITKVNKTLSMPSGATKDETLMTVMLLALYANVTCRDAKFNRSWAAHIDGAAHLLQLRGQEQFHTKAGVTMFIHLRARIITACFLRSRPVPPQLLTLSQQSHPFQTQDELKTAELADIAFRVCSFRESLSKERFANADEIIDAVIALDNAMEAWATTLPFEYIWTSVAACLWRPLRYLHEQVD